MSKPVISEEQLKKYVPSTEVWLFNNQETDAKWTNLSIFICAVAVILITLPWFFLDYGYREASWDLSGYWAIAVMAPATVVAIIHTLRYGKYLLTGHILKYSVEPEMPTSEARPAVIFMWLIFALLSLAVSIASIIVFYLLYVVVSNLIVLIILSSVIIFLAVAYYLRKKRQREIVTFEILKRSNND